MTQWQLRLLRESALLGPCLPNEISKLAAALRVPHVVKVKVKSSMARSLPGENLLPQNVGSIINYLQ